MPVFELSAVTDHLERLCKTGVEARVNNAITVHTSSVSPLDAPSQNHNVNVFLFHFHPELPANRSDDPEIDPARPIHFPKPMTLFYHVTAHHAQGTRAHLVEQDLLGHVMATLLDYSELSDSLQFGGARFFDDALRNAGNYFEIEILKKSDSEALNVWAGYEGGAIRPSIFFKVRNVRLQPEPPPGQVLPILSIGNLTLPNMGPRIMSLTSTMTATLPLPTGAVTREFTREPAELFLGAAPGDRELTLQGSSIDPSVAVELTLPGAGGSETFRIDFIENAALGWILTVVDRRVVLTTGTTIRREAGGAMAARALEPGGARLRVFRTEMLTREGIDSPAELPSNPVAFTLHPHIDAVTLVAGRRYRIDLGGDFDLGAVLPASGHAAHLRLAIGGALFDVRDGAAGLGPGQCAVTGVRSVEYVLHDLTDAAALALIQLWIRDCVNQPFWVGTA
jgi:hypothetical protein